MGRADARAPMEATGVGSYPVPAWLPRPATRDALRDATMAVLRVQELAGLDVVTDGELYRFDPNHPETNGMIDYFARGLEGVSTDVTRAERLTFAGARGLGYRLRPAGVVRGPVRSGTLDLEADCARVRELVPRGRGPRLKFTLTGPHMLARVLLDRHYGDPAALAGDLAAALAEQVAGLDCDVVQIDEANIPGHPEDGAWAAEAINRVLAAVPAGVERAVHVCFGNYGGQRVQRGEWRALLPFLGALRADHLVLEAARGAGDGPAVFAELPPGLGVGVGVIDVKDLAIETPEQVARRIEGAARALGPGRLRCVHPDCGLWMLPRNVADGKLAALVAGRDLFLGRV